MNSKQKINDNGIILIINCLKCKRVKCSDQKTKTSQMNTKTKPLYLLSIRDSPQTYKLKVAGVGGGGWGTWEKIFQANGDQKKAGVATLISNKKDFKTKAVKRDKEGHYIMIKGSIQEEDITIISI